MDSNDRSETVELTADIVSAYVSKHSIRPDELGKLIGEVHRALTQVPQQGPAEPAQKPQEPAVSIRSSVKPDYIVCLEDGKKFKSLRRHLQVEHGMAPNDYRAKWGLKSDYPMTAPAYSEARSQMAKSLGLGRKAAAPAEKPAPTKQTRRKKSSPPANSGTSA